MRKEKQICRQSVISCQQNSSQPPETGQARGKDLQGQDICVSSCPCEQNCANMNRGNDLRGSTLSVSAAHDTEGFSVIHPE